MKKKRNPIVIWTIAAPFLLFLASILHNGLFEYSGPFKLLNIHRLKQKYKDRTGQSIIFYGASNFRLWKTMEKDMLPYNVQNKGFSGATDRDLIQYAGQLVYPSSPTAVCFQTGSNDWAEGLSFDEICSNKDTLLTLMRTNLPDTALIVLSGLPLPGRTQYWSGICRINEYLDKYCRCHDNMYFIDATSVMMTPEGCFCKELFNRDGIHLNAKGQALWCAQIKAVFNRLPLNNKEADAALSPHQP